MIRRLRTASIALVMALGLALGGAAPAMAESCDADPRRRQLDFWVGEWQLFGEDGQPVGSHHVRKSEKGCALEERWESAGGGTARGLGYFDPALGGWRLSRVDDGGRVARYEGELRGGAMHFLGTFIEADGGVRRARLVLTPRPGPAVHQRIDLEGEGQPAWSPYFDGTFHPLGRPPPVAAEVVAGASPPSETPSEESGETPSEISSVEAEPEPEASAASAAPAAAEGPADLEPGPAAPAATTPPPATPPAAVPAHAGPAPAAAPPAPPAVGHGSVRPQTGMVTSEALARGRVTIPMASPMVLRFPVGRIDRLDPGYAWTTREVARYECEGTTVQAIRMTRGRPKGGRQPIEVTARLASSRRFARVALEIALLAGDERVAEAALPDAQVGMGLPAQIQDGAIERTLVLELEKGRLGELFAGEQRPELELTLTELRRGE